MKPKSALVVVDVQNDFISGKDCPDFNLQAHDCLLYTNYGVSMGEIVTIFIIILGSLAIKNCPAGQNGEEVVPPINRLLDTVPFTMHCYSLDWHPSDHISFFENVHKRKLSHDSKAELQRRFFADLWGGPLKLDP